MSFKLKKGSLPAAIGNSVDLFASATYYTGRMPKLVLKQSAKGRKSPSDQSFSEALKESFQNVGDDLRWAVDDYKKRKTG